MGLDLTLIPADDWTKDKKTKQVIPSYATTLLRCDAARLLRDALSGLPEQPAGKEFVTFRGQDANGYRFMATPTDGYSTPLRWATAGDLVKLRRHEAVQSFAQNRAVWAYLSHLMAATPVALFWH